jgi:hypothetical protein
LHILIDVNFGMEFGLGSRQHFARRSFGIEAENDTYLFERRVYCCTNTATYPLEIPP